ncbi:MAG: hypothetical protein KDJ17_08410 [Hyphomicrobiaceae bacterium]|nr:hypothetical protein [Hyphomicrobiaceae bacterium]
MIDTSIRTPEQATKSEYLAKGRIRLGLAFACALSAAALLSPPSFAAGTELVLGVGTEPDTVDVQGQTSTAVQNYMQFTIEALVKLTEDGSIAPSLAESWEMSDDGLTYTFKLRQNVQFQDGTPFNADAVKWNFDRLFDESVRVTLRKQFSTISDVEIIDPYTVAFHLSAPYPAFLGTMSSVNAGMMSPAGIETMGNTYSQIVHPIGTGPYKFVEYVQADHLKFERWDGYWGEKPYYETQLLKLMPEPASREAALLSGQVDIIMHPPSADIGKLQSDPKLNVIVGDTTRVVYFAFNNQAKEFADVRVRQALNYAVDKDAIIKNVLFDAAIPVHSLLSKYMASYCDSGTYEYDPDKARALLEEAGATGLEVELVAPAGHYIQDRQAASAVAAYLSQVGIKASVRTTDWASYLDLVAIPGTEQGPRINMFGYAGSSPDQATPVFSVFFGTDSMPPNGFNTAFYSNPAVDDLWAKASQETNKAKRDELYCDAQKIFWEDAPWIFLWNQGLPIVTSAAITGVFTTPNEMYNTVYARPTP